MNGSKRTVAGTFLLNTRGTGWLAQHSALANENNMTVRELLLELTGQTGVVVSNRSLNHKGVMVILTAAEHGGSPAGKVRGQR